MAEWLDALLQRMRSIPEPLVHLILGLVAALENLIPPIPADVVILFGGFLAGQGSVSLATAFVVVWLSNVSGALFVYGMGRAYGPRFFAARVGRLLLKPRQLASLSAFYHRYGFAVIFVSRFLPMFRGLVPVFAGVSRLGFLRTTLPIVVASAIWYGAVLYLGALAGENWETILARLDAGARWLGLAALLLAVAVAWWWWTSRRHPDHPHEH